MMLHNGGRVVVGNRLKLQSSGLPKNGIRAPRWTPENRPYVDTSKPANEVAEVRTRSVIPWDA
jgi:hypothetical protein